MISDFAEEEEILFMFGCIFRLGNVWFDEEHKLWRAQLTLCGENDDDMRSFKVNLMGELDGKSELVALGTYLVQMQKYEETEYHYEKLIENNIIDNEFDLADCYHGLACVNDLKGDLHMAIVNFCKALEYLDKNSPNHDHPLIAECYNNLDSIYGKEENYKLVFQFYEKALLTKNNVPSVTYAGISHVHFGMTNYNLALEFTGKSLEKQPEKADSDKADT